MMCLLGDFTLWSEVCVARGLNVVSTDPPEQGGQTGPWPVWSIKFYWNTAVPVDLSIVYGCFPPLMAELGRCKGDCRACKRRVFRKYYCPVFHRKRVWPPV